MIEIKKIQKVIFSYIDPNTLCINDILTLMATAINSKTKPDIKLPFNIDKISFIYGEGNKFLYIKVEVYSSIGSWITTFTFKPNLYYYFEGINLICADKIDNI